MLRDGYKHFRHCAIDTNEQRMNAEFSGFLRCLFQAFFSVLYIYLLLADEYDVFTY